MEVKTFTMGFVEGTSEALKGLDERVREELGTEIRIHSVTDTLYRREDTKDAHLYVARVVVYESQ